MGAKSTSQVLGKLGAIQNLIERDPVCGEIVAYLSRHARAVDTARGIAEWWINRELRATQEALLKLLDHGVLRSYVQGATRVYAYTNNPLIRRQLARYVKSTDNHDSSHFHPLPPRGRGEGEGR